MPSPTAVDAQGPLSTGDNSNPAFAEPARVGDVAYVDVAPPAGYEHPHYIIPGIPGVQMSLDGLFFELVGNSVTIGAFTGTVRVWLKIVAEANPAPKFILPTDGFVEVVGNQAAGAAGAVTGAAGAVGEKESAAGATGSSSGAVGSAAPVGSREAAGAAGSTSGAAGSAETKADASGGTGATSGSAGAVDEKELAAGSSGSASGAFGAVGEKETVAGSSGSASGAAGAAELSSSSKPPGTYTETRYLRSDTHTVNTRLLQKLLKTADATRTELASTQDGSGLCQIWIYKVAADGTETVLASNVATMSFPFGEYEDVIRSATWSCPGYSLLPTDAIMVRWFLDVSSGYQSVLGITEPLGASSLPAGTWTFYACQDSNFDGEGTAQALVLGADRCRVEGFKYTVT